MNQKRKELLEKSIDELVLRDNQGDCDCTTCSGHGCVDTGNEFGCVFEYCPDCYQLTEKEKELGRSSTYYQMSSQEQWDEDKRLGILDWDGK